MNYNFTIRGAAGGTPPHSHDDLIKSTVLHYQTLKNRPNPMSSRLGQKKTKSGIQTTDRQRQDSEKDQVRHSVDRPTTSRLGKTKVRHSVDRPTTSRLGKTKVRHSVYRPTTSRLGKSQASSVSPLDASPPPGPRRARPGPQQMITSGTAIDEGTRIDAPSIV